MTFSRYTEKSGPGQEKIEYIFLKNYARNSAEIPF